METPIKVFLNYSVSGCDSFLLVIDQECSNIVTCAVLPARVKYIHQEASDENSKVKLCIVVVLNGQLLQSSLACIFKCALRFFTVILKFFHFLKYYWRLSLFWLGFGLCRCVCPIEQIVSLLSPYIHYSFLSGSQSVLINQAGWLFCIHFHSLRPYFYSN